jgi:cellulose biosynthesis protein BcsQ
MISCNFAYNVAKQGKRVLYFALEPGNSVIDYLASIWARKRFSDLKEPDFQPPKGLSIDFYTKEEVDSLEEMVAIVENLDRYDLVIIDHFGYFVKGSNKTQAEADAMKIMAATAKKNRTCLLLSVHPRKPNTKKQRELTIHDISGSAAFPKTLLTY